MVDVATKPAQEKKKEQQKKAVVQSLLLASKDFKIVESKAKNEPDLSLKLIYQLVKTLHESFFSGSDHVSNPNPSVIKIIAGTQAIGDSRLFFDLEGVKTDDIKEPRFGETYIEKTLYPDDVIVIIDYLRKWLVQPDFYKEELKGFSWGISIDALITEWRAAVKRKAADPQKKSKHIFDFSNDELRQAVEELFEQIEIIYSKIVEDVTHDPVDDLLKEIDQNFAKDPEEVWKKIGLVISEAMVDGVLGSKLLIIPNKKIHISDARKIINAFYAQVVALIRPEEPKEPWDRASDKTKERFNPSQPLYFTYNQINEDIVLIFDTTSAGRFIEWINQLLEELGIKPDEDEAVADETTDEADDAGAEGQDETPTSWNTQDLTKKIIQNLTNRSWDDFLNYFTDAILNPQTNVRFSPNDLNENQTDWLLVNLPGTINVILENDDNQDSLVEFIQSRIKAELKTDEANITVSESQITSIQKQVNQFFFAENAVEFIQFINSLPSSEDLDQIIEEGILKPEVSRPVVPPKVDLKTKDIPTDASGLLAGFSLKRSKFYANTATVLLSAYLESSDPIPGLSFAEIKNQYPELYENILGFLITELAGYSEEELVSTLRYKLFSKLLLRSEFNTLIEKILLKSIERNPQTFEKVLFIVNQRGDQAHDHLHRALYRSLINNPVFSQEFTRIYGDYLRIKLNRLGLGDAKSLGNIYRALDPLLFLGDDPEGYILSLSEKEVRSYLDIQDSNINVKELKEILIRLIILRKIYYLTSTKGIPLKPLYKGEKGQQVLRSNPSLVTQAREIFTTAEKQGSKEDLIVALNVSAKDIKDHGILLNQFRPGADGEVDDPSLTQERRLSISEQRLNYLREQNWREIIVGLDYEQLGKLYSRYSIFEFDVASPAPPPLYIFSQLVGDANSAVIGDMENVSPEARPVLGEKNGIKEKIAKNAYKAMGSAVVKAIPKAAAAEKILKAMGLGKLTDDIEEKIGKAITIAGAAILAAIGALISIIQQAIVWGIAGGLLTGGAVFAITGNPIAAIAAAGPGAAAFSTFGKWLKSNGGAGGIFNGLLGGDGTSTISGIKTSSGFKGAIPPVIAVPTVIVGATAGSMYISQLNSEASLRPVTDTYGETGRISKYVDIKKSSSSADGDVTPPDEISYQITITAKEYAIDISSASDKSSISCRDSEEKITSDNDVSKADGASLAPGESIDIEYNQPFGSNLDNCRIINSFNLNFDYTNTTDTSDSGTSTATTSLMLGYGEYPKGEGCWPATGLLKFGPGADSHTNIEGGAIDILSNKGTSIYAPYEGEACAYGEYSGKPCGSGAEEYFLTKWCYGKHVIVNTGEFTMMFAHLDDFHNLSPGQCTQVNEGTQIGYMGNSGMLNYQAKGDEVGVHLHFEYAGPGGISSILPESVEGVVEFDPPLYVTSECGL